MGLLRANLAVETDTGSNTCIHFMKPGGPKIIYHRSGHALAPKLRPKLHGKRTIFALAILSERGTARSRIIPASLSVYMPGFVVSLEIEI